MTRLLTALLIVATATACTTFETGAPRLKPTPDLAADAAPVQVDAPAAVAVQAPAPVATAATPDTVARVPPTLLDVLRDGFTLDHATDQARVRQHIDWFARHPTYLSRLQPRIERYLPALCARVRARELPTELCLLPIIESALDPLAFSPGGAAGLWQFIPATARRYGLQLDWWVDERRDPIAATDAALDYLDALHQRFGDWSLAIAAYNCGEGRVAKALRRAGDGADFFDLVLPRETAAYLPRLLAFAAVTVSPDTYDIELPFAEVDAEERALAAISTGGQIDLARAAEAVGVTVEALYRDNPALNQWSTHPDGPHRLLVPAAMAAQAQAALDAIPDHERLAWQRHRIAPDDTLGGLAVAFNTDVATLKRVNNLNSSRIRAGDHLLIPRATLDTTEYPTPRSAREARGTVYLVQAGDSLWTIAREFEVSTRALMRVNHVGPKDVLRIGQRLVVPAGKGPPSSMRKVTYRVRSGDSLARISAKFNVSVREIADWNSLDPQALIHPGQALVLHVDVRAART